MEASPHVTHTSALCTASMWLCIACDWKLEFQRLNWLFFSLKSSIFIWKVKDFNGNTCLWCNSICWLYCCGIYNCCHDDQILLFIGKNTKMRVFMGTLFLFSSNFHLTSFNSRSTDKKVKAPFSRCLRGLDGQFVNEPLPF